MVPGMVTWLERWPVEDGTGPTVGVKDLIDVAGSVTTGGCRTLADHSAPALRDAACITSVRRAGGRLVGKTNLHELAFGTSGINPWFGTPPNPADAGRVPGGSSSGSAVAVAIGEADVALGTDTGGSVRIPAGCCGVVGLKTTHGLVSLAGVWPLAPSFDSVGVLAADVRRVIVGMALLGVEGFGGERGGLESPALGQAGVWQAGDEVPAVVGRAVLGPAVEVDPVIDAAIDSALRSAEMSAEPVTIGTWKAAWAAQQRLLVEEAWQSDRHLLEIDGGAGVSEEIRVRLIAGSGIDAATIEADRATGVAWRAELAELVARHGVLALPTLAVRPPMLDDFGGPFNLLTAPMNFAGFPAISLPAPVAEPGRPAASLQLVGLPGTERLLCAAAARVEAAVTA